MFKIGDRVKYIKTIEWGPAAGECGEIVDMFPSGSIFGVKPDGSQSIYYTLTSDVCLIPAIGIRELQMQLKEVRTVYEADCKRIKDQIQALRSKRGYKLKQPSWDGHVEIGRDRIHRTPHGDM